MEGQTYAQPRSSAFGLVFAAALPTLRDVAKAHGYALAVHGSMHRDLDLIACPWVEDAAEPQVLADALREAVKGRFTWQNRSFEDPSPRPHGRLAYAFYLDRESWQGQDGPFIDLSIMPRLVPGGDG